MQAPPAVHGSIVTADFQAWPLASGPHAQTILPHLLRPLPRLELEIERWELADGDFVDLGWFCRPQPGQAIAVLVHGLTGGFNSKYLRGTAKRLKALGWAGVVLQLRGAGEEPNRLPRNYHQGDTEDLHALLAGLRADFPASFLAVVGWSLGGNVVLKAAGEQGAGFAADAVAAASVPFVLAPCAERLNEGLSRLYGRNLLRDLKTSAQAKAARMVLPPGVDLEATLAAEDFFAYDDAWTAPLNGFSSARDYYQRCQCGGFLAHIAKPCLIVHSQDDPFMRTEIVPAAAELAPSVRLELTQRGGHVGFLGRGPWGLPQLWLEARLSQWLDEQRGA